MVFINQIHLVINIPFHFPMDLVEMVKTSTIVTTMIAIVKKSI
jgi:hypothetical protein